LTLCNFKLLQEQGMLHGVASFTVKSANKWQE